MYVPLGHLLEHQEALLDDLNRLAVAHKLAGGGDLSGLRG
jgi:hypothetical protein